MILSSCGCKNTTNYVNIQIFFEEKKKKSSRAHARITYYIKYIVCSKGFAETVTGMKFDYNNPSTLVAIYNKLQNK